MNSDRTIKGVHTNHLASSTTALDRIMVEAIILPQPTLKYLKIFDEIVSGVRLKS